MEKRDDKSKAKPTPKTNKIRGAVNIVNRRQRSISLARRG